MCICILSKSNTFTELPELSPLHPRLVALAMKWVEQKPASSQALNLLRIIAQQCTGNI